MNNETFCRLLTLLGGCNEGLYWVEDSGFTAYEAWWCCPRPEWMLWLVLELANRGGTNSQWYNYFVQLWGKEDTTAGWTLDEPVPNPTPDEIRKAVPWELVWFAIEREETRYNL